MFDWLERIEIQMALARQKQEATARKQGGAPRQPKRPNARDESRLFVWRLVADAGCQMVGYGYRMRSRAWPERSQMANLLIRSGQSLRRRALLSIKPTPCG